MTHMLKHQGVNPFKCDQCSFETIWKDCLVGHLKTHLQKKKLKQYKCYRCKYQTTLLFDYNTHLAKHYR